MTPEPKTNPFELGGAPMTPEPKTSAKVERYKWEPYGDIIGWCMYCFQPRRRHALEK